MQNDRNSLPLYRKHYTAPTAVMNDPTRVAPVHSVAAGFLHLIFVAFVAARIVAAEPVVPAGQKQEPEKFDWSSILPTAMEKNPRLMFTVVTETTDEGKKLAAPSPGHPVFFQLHAAGYQEVGDTPRGEKTVKADDIERVLLRSLATNGYLPAAAGQVPSLFIVYGWGTHYRRDAATLDNAQKNRNMLDRAALMGGDKFAQELYATYLEASNFESTGKKLPPEVREFLNPINVLKRKDDKTQFLVEHTEDDIYFVIASAYDYRAVTEHRHELLWRTRMTVGAQGVTQEQTLPALVATAGPYFGKETNGAELISRRTIPQGNVEIGTPTVVETSAPAPRTPGAPEKK